MANPPYRRDSEVAAISEQFRILKRRVSDLVDDIDATILLFDAYRKKQQTFGEETENEVKEL